MKVWRSIGQAVSENIADELSMILFCDVVVRVVSIEFFNRDLTLAVFWLCVAIHSCNYS